MPFSTSVKNVKEIRSSPYCLIDSDKEARSVETYQVVLRNVLWHNRPISVLGVALFSCERRRQLMTKLSGKVVRQRHLVIITSQQSEHLALSIPPYSMNY